MGWLILRVAVAVLAAAAGGLIGATLGSQAPLLGAILGSGVGTAVLVAMDGLRGARLMAWLRGPQVQDAPRDAGFWGELGYRFERSLRSLERGVAQEQTRLSQFLSAIEASPNGVLLLDETDRIDW